MAMGEAAGTAAAMGVSLDRGIRQVDVKQLQARLEQHGAILSPDFAVPAGGNR